MEHIFDRIDYSLKEFNKNEKRSPRYLLLGLNSLALLREELGLPIDDSLTYYKGFKILVDESEDILDAETVNFV